MSEETDNVVYELKIDPPLSSTKGYYQCECMKCMPSIKDCARAGYPSI